MLTSSPIAPQPTSASPRAFHYAPTRSPHQSPRVTAALPRRQSKHTILQSPSGSLVGPNKSTSQSRSKQYVGVDAATQYSPMEPFDPTVMLQGVRPRAPGDAAASGPDAAQTAAETTTTVANPQSAIPEAPPEPNIEPIRRAEEVKQASAAANNPVSPAKRRNSQELTQISTTTGSTSASSVVTSSRNSPKRSRPSEGPPKVLPLRYELCDVEDMVVLISNMLSELIETNDSIAMKNSHLTRFHSRTAPGISVLDYLHRLAKHATLSPPLLLSMVYYIDRLCALYPDFTINTLTVHRFLITAATVAGKGLSDSFWNNTFYAKVGGVKVQELKLLELEFLYRVDWKIVPNPEVLVAYYKGLIERCGGYALEGDALPGVDGFGEDESDVVDEDSDEIYDQDGSGEDIAAPSEP
ncbi:nuc-1 negative regulatory protein preg [Apiospora saccharicola]|uniref:Nuc-1 negative regulatory protein preg n=1 Tax=Apiospora saccharicola TaxID=335842 RepID=A0ABR1W1Y3_9PEZI